VIAIQFLEKKTCNCAKCDFSSYITIVYSAADAVCMVYGMLVLNSRILGTKDI